VPLVIHDPVLWTDGAQLHLRHQSETSGLRPLWVRDLDWTELEHAPVVWLDGRPERLTRLEQVIEAVPERLWLDVELKAGWTYDPALARVFASCARRRRSGRVLASSFDQVALRDVATLDPGIPLLAILHARPVDLIGVLRTIPAVMASIDRPFLTANDVRRWTEIGVEVSIGGSELVGDLETVLTWPIAGLFLDDPRLALSAGP
ncbi:MAG: glycerophosphodiester phosphodiesterase, partial [Acidimicrobiales bacterium]